MLFAQKKLWSDPEEVNKVIRLFSGLADLDYEPCYNNHIYFQYLSNIKDDIALLDAYHPNKIFDKYIIRVAGKGFTLVDHPSEIYGMPDTHECIDGNLPLHLILDINARQKLFFPLVIYIQKKIKLTVLKKIKCEIMMKLVIRLWHMSRDRKEVLS